MAEQSSGERTEDPTPRRKQEARKKGTVAKSTDLVGAIGLLAAALVIPSVVSGIGTALRGGLAQTLGEVPTQLSPVTIVGFTSEVATPLILACLPLMLTLLVVGLLVNFGQVGFVLSGESLKPSFAKINPGAGFKRVFSRRSTMEGAKAMAKLAIFSYVVYAAVHSEWANIVALGEVEPTASAGLLGQILHTILVRVALVWLVIATIDYIFQRKEVDKQIKMTKDELKREMKEQEGSPEVKAAQYQRRRKILKGGMAKTLQEADVLITNPTHFAVAIKYKRNEMHAPMVLAKGQDYLALKMREIAEMHGVPMVENKPLARGLYKACEAGDFIPREFFGPVAEVLAYILKSTKRASR